MTPQPTRNYLLRTTLGFTLIEVVVTLAIFSVISVAAVWMVFTTLALRDKAAATIRSQESLRVFISSLNLATRGATAVSATSTTLSTTAPSNCWSFSYNAATLSLLFDSSSVASCSPPSATTAFFDSSTKVDSLAFSVLTLATGGREIRVQGTIHTYLPLADYALNFSETVVNLVD